MHKLTSSIAIFSACIVSAAQGHAAEFYATDPADSYIQGDGFCSLREAVDTANYNDCWADCGCGDPQNHVDRDIVYLYPNVNYELDDRLDVWDSVEIVGGGSSVIYAGDNGYFPGIVVSSDAYDVVLRDFWLTNFKSPTLVADTGSLVLTYGLFVYENHFSIGSGQNASVLAQPFSYILLDNFVSAYNSEAIKGGGLFVGTNASVELNQAFITGNAASQYGGGAHVQGSLSCSDSTISDNSAHLQGGGIYVTGTGHLYANGCDVSDNTAPISPNIYQ